MTNKASVIAIAPELATLDDTLFDLICNDVEYLVDLSSCPHKAEMAKTYLAAHLLTLAKDPSAGGFIPSGSPVKSEKAGRESRSYGDNIAYKLNSANRYDATKYGTIFNSIAMSCVDTLGAVVV